MASTYSPYFYVIDAHTNKLDNDEDITAHHVRFTTRNEAKAISTFEDLCACHELVRLERLRQDPGMPHPLVLEVKTGGLS